MIQIQGYEILNPLGIGGMGEVYLANQLETKKLVALKLLLPEYVSDPDFKEMFLHEGRIAADLNHPHIVTIFDVGESEGTPYLAMEYLAAGDLKAMLTGGSNRFMAMRAIHQIAGALTYTHGLGITHGDIKPQNILFRDVGQAVLSDFGSAHEKRGFLKSDASSFTVGSPLYISPEQVRGERPTYLSDIYGLGVILFETLTGHPPFLARTPVETARLRLEATEPPLLPEEHVEYQRFIDSMMALDPEDRRIELKEFINDFQGLMQGNAAEPIDKTQRLSMEQYVERKESDFFYIAPQNISESQERTQEIPVQAEAGIANETPPGSYQEVRLASGGYDDVAIAENQTVIPQPATVDLDPLPEPEPEPVKEWVTTETEIIADEDSNGKLDDLVFFLQDFKDNFKENAKNRAQNYPNAADIDLYLRPVKNEVKKQTVVVAESISRQTRIWFVVGILLFGSGVVGLFLSQDQSSSAVDESEFGVMQPLRLPGSDSTPSDLSEPLMTTSQSNPETGVNDVNVNIQTIDDTPSETQLAKDQEVAEIALIESSSAEAELSTEAVIEPSEEGTADVDAVEVESAALTEGETENAPELNKLETGVTSQAGQKAINNEVEDALGRHVGWMVRNNDGSLSLFIDWVDLVAGGVSDDFSEAAKKSLNVMAYIIRNYDGFNISISDHSHQQRTISVARSYKVMNYLRNRGVPNDRMRTQTLLSEITGNLEMRLIPEG